MSGPAASASRLNWRLLSAAMVAIAVAVFIAANAHLIYVAFASQPECVPHLKDAGRDAGAFRAANSAC